MRTLLFFLLILILQPAYSIGDISAWYKVHLYELKEDTNGVANLDSLSSQDVHLFLDDSAFYVTKGIQRTAYDFKKEKIYFLNVANNTYDETSLFAEVDYRRAEFSSRFNLKKFLNTEGIDNKFGTIFDLETLFGMELKKDSISQYLEISESLSQQIFYIKKNPVTNVQFTEVRLEEKENIFHKFLLYETQVHPYIIRQIIVIGKLPKKMSFRFLNSGKKYVVTYQLMKYSDKAHVGELNNSLFSYNYQSKDELSTAINKIYGFVHTDFVKLKTKETCIEEYELHLKKKKYIDAFLVLMECNLSRNEDFHNEFELLKQKAEHDKNFQTFLSALKKAESESELNERIKAFESLNRKKIEKGYLIDAFLSNYYSSLGDKSKAFKLYSNVIAHNPYITSVFCDLGDLFAEQSNMRMAWKCYEIAAKIEPSHPMCRKTYLRRKFLEYNFPEFFF